MRYYKWLADEKPVYGSGVYATPGEWQPRIEGELMPCKNGYHILTAEQVPYWCGTGLIEVEVSGEVITQTDKCVCRTWREIKRYRWTTADMIAYAHGCADLAAAYAADAARAAAYADDYAAAAAYADAAAYAAYAAVAATTAYAAFAAARDAAAYTAARDAARAAARDAAFAAARAATFAAAAAYTAYTAAARDAAAYTAYCEARCAPPEIAAAVRQRQKAWIEDRIGEKLT